MAYPGRSVTPDFIHNNAGNRGDARIRSSSLAGADHTPRASMMMAEQRPVLHVDTPAHHTTLPTRSQSASTLALPARAPISPQANPSRAATLNNLRQATAMSPSLSTSSLTTSPSMNSITSAGSRYGARAVALAMDKLENRDNRSEAKSGDLGPVGAVNFGGSDEWQTVAVRVLPLFNGEGAKGYIEDLNELVSVHTRRIASRSPSKAIIYLSQHLSELLSIGMLTLRDKLKGLQGDKLLIRLNDLWSFFFSSILPYIEAIFLPFSTDSKLLRATSAQHAGDSGQATSIGVRKLSLIAFRDQIVLPLRDQLEPLFWNQARSATSRRNSDAFDTSFTTSPELARSSSVFGDLSEGQAKRMQMMSLLTSVMTGDTQQSLADKLNLALKGYSTSRDSVSTFRTKSRADLVTSDSGEQLWSQQFQPERDSPRPGRSRSTTSRSDPD